MEKKIINSVNDLHNFLSDKQLNNFYFCNFYINQEPGWVIYYILALEIYLKKNNIYNKGKIIAICLEGTEFLYQILDIDYLLIIDLKDELKYWDNKYIEYNKKKDFNEKTWKDTFYYLNRFDIFDKLTLLNNYLRKCNFKDRINDKIIMNPKIRFDSELCKKILKKEKVEGLDLTSLKKNDKKKCYELLNWSDSFYTMKQILGYGICYRIDFYDTIFNHDYSELFLKLKNGLKITPKIKNTKYITIILKNTFKHPEKNTPISLVNKIIKQYYENKKDYKVLVIHDIIESKINILPNVIELKNNNFTFTYQNLYEYVVNSETIYAVSAMMEFVGFFVNCNIVIPLKKNYINYIESITKYIEYLVRDTRGKTIEIIDENNNKYIYRNNKWVNKTKPNLRTFNH